MTKITNQHLIKELIGSGWSILSSISDIGDFLLINRQEDFSLMVSLNGENKKIHFKINGNSKDNIIISKEQLIIIDKLIQQALVKLPKEYYIAPYCPLTQVSSSDYLSLIDINQIDFLGNPELHKLAKNISSHNYEKILLVINDIIDRNVDVNIQDSDVKTFIDILREKNYLKEVATIEYTLLQKEIEIRDGPGLSL